MDSVLADYLTCLMARLIWLAHKMATAGLPYEGSAEGNDSFE